MKPALLVNKHNVLRQVLVFKWNTDLKESAEADSLAEAHRVLGNSNRKRDLATVNLEPANADGLELMKELRMTAPDVPVLAITMKRDVDRRDRALWAGEVLIMAAPPRRSSTWRSVPSANNHHRCLYFRGRFNADKCAVWPMAAASSAAIVVKQSPIRGGRHTHTGGLRGQLSSLQGDDRRRPSYPAPGSRSEEHNP